MGFPLEIIYLHYSNPLPFPFATLSSAAQSQIPAKAVQLSMFLETRWTEPKTRRHQTLTKRPGGRNHDLLSFLTCKPGTPVEILGLLELLECDEWSHWQEHLRGSHQSTGPPFFGVGLDPPQRQATAWEMDYFWVKWCPEASSRWDFSSAVVSGTHNVGLSSP